MADQTLFGYCREHPYSALVLFMMITTYMLNQFDRYMFGVSKIPFVDYDSTEYSTLAGPAFTIIYTLAGVALGTVGDGVNRVHMLCIALVFWSVMTGLVALTDAFWQVALLRVGQGIGEAGCTPFASSIIGDYFSSDLRGAAMGLYNAGVYLGYGGCLGLGTWLHDELGWGAGYVILAVVGVGVAVAMFVTVKEPERKDKDPGASTASTASTEQGVGAAWERLKRVASFWKGSPSLLLLCLAGGVRNGGGYVWGSYTAIFFSPLWETDDDAGSCSASYGEGGCSSDYPYCIDGECSKLESAPWHNEGMSHARFEAWMSWIPLVAGTLGALLGGLIADQLAKRDGGPASRVMLILLSNLLAAPFALAALVAPYPWCFLSLLGSNIFGEMWIGVTLALVIELVPPHMRVTSVALYLFTITNIGGNMPFFVPYLQSAYDESHTFEFTTDDGFAHAITEKGAHGLQAALIWLFPGVYALSSGFFLVTFFALRRDVERAKEAAGEPLLAGERGQRGSLNVGGGEEESA